jgi:hypothetical protein
MSKYRNSNKLTKSMANRVIHVMPGKVGICIICLHIRSEWLNLKQLLMSGSRALREDLSLSVMATTAPNIFGSVFRKTELNSLLLEPCDPTLLTMWMAIGSTYISLIVLKPEPLLPMLMRSFNSFLYSKCRFSKDFSTEDLFLLPDFKILLMTYSHFLLALRKICFKMFSPLNVLQILSLKIVKSFFQLRAYLLTELSPSW